jgi:hypothetical protein
MKLELEWTLAEGTHFLWDAALKGLCASILSPEVDVDGTRRRFEIGCGYTKARFIIISVAAPQTGRQAGNNTVCSLASHLALLIKMDLLASDYVFESSVDI